MEIDTHDERHRTLDHAYRTLIRGIDFIDRQRLRSGCDDPVPGDPLPGDRVAVRLLGNRLRELDRFLGVMAEEAAGCLDLPGHDARAFARLRNGPNKLRAVHRLMQADSPDHERLRAVGRISACLHHCGGRVHGAAGRARLAPAGAWFDVAARQSEDEPGAAMMVMSGTGLATICLLYRKSAEDLLAEISRWRRLH